MPTGENKAKDITPSIACRREASKEEALDELPRKDEKRSSSVRRTDWNSFTCSTVETSERLEGAYICIISKRVNTTMN